MSKVRLTVGLAAVFSFILAVVSVQAQVQLYRLTDKQMKQLLEQVEKDAKKFREQIKKGTKNNRYNISRNGDDLVQLAEDFEISTKRLKDRFDGRRSVAADVEEVLRRAAPIDRFMQRNPLVTRADREWLAVRDKLDEVASAYNVSWQWDRPRERPHRLNDREMKSLLARLEHNANQYRDSVKQELRHTRFDETRVEDNINQVLKDFAKATDRLRDQFNDGKSVEGEVQEVLRWGATIDRFMQRHRLSERAHRDWREVQRSLNELARAYNVSLNAMR